MEGIDYSTITEDELNSIKGSIHADVLEESLNTLSGYASKHIQQALVPIKPYMYSIIKGKKDIIERKSKEKIPYSEELLKVNSDPAKVVKVFYDSMTEILKHYSDVVALEQHYTGECQDLLHLLELGEPNDNQKELILNDLRVARSNRRIAKDLSTMTKPLYDMTQKNKKFMDSLSDAYKETRELETHLKNRK